MRAIGVLFMAALVKGHGYSKVRVPRQMAVLHTREGCDGQRSGVSTVVLSRVGLRSDVLHLQELLSGAGLLRGWVPRPDETRTEAARQAATPAKSGRTARSPGPTTGLPGTVPSPARDGSYFRRQRPIRQHRGDMDGNENEHVMGGDVSGSAPIGAAPNRHPARLHPVWACGCEQDRPGEGETMMQEKEEDGEKYLSVETEDEFHEALKRGHPSRCPPSLPRRSA